jgi:hypothetical protein
VTTALIKGLLYIAFIFSISFFFGAMAVSVGPFSRIASIVRAAYFVDEVRHQLEVNDLPRRHIKREEISVISRPTAVARPKEIVPPAFSIRTDAEEDEEERQEDRGIADDLAVFVVDRSAFDEGERSCRPTFG